LAASIAHEVNNPLSGVLIYVELLSQKISKGNMNKEVILDYLSKMNFELTRSTHLIQSLLDFAKQSEMKMEEVDINKVLTQALDISIPAGSGNNIQVEKELPALPKVIADPALLEQVFINLVRNALQAMPARGKMTLRTWVEDQEVKIAIQDTGCGIPPENMSKLFTPFFSTKKEVKGVGLGLSVSYGIIQRLHGKIEVKSKVGEGSTFTVCLPISLPTSENTL
jgi:signal transduction histidine kinase